MFKLRTILLAEDNPKDVELTLEAMAENNLANDIFVVKDGVEALEYLHCQGKYKLRKAGNPALVLLDIKMPRMDGIEVLRNIRSDAKLKRIPVVVLTSSREENDLINTYDLGVNAYVLKPVDFKQFIEAVKQIGSFWAVLNELPPERSV
jgi:CheY-like chemotaxis protein